MGWFTLPRKPETEVMAGEGEVDAYVSAAAQSYLSALDDTLVEQVLSLGIEEGRVLDVGTGPGSIPVKIGRSRPRLRLVGVDRSRAMLCAGSKGIREQIEDTCVSFCQAEALRLPFLDNQFVLVLSNSVLHHLQHPAAVFKEMARVTKPKGTVLLRDLRRPSRLAFAAHVWWNGRYYSGRMRQLYEDSVRAAYTTPELVELVRASGLRRARIFSYKRTHLGLIWQKGPAPQEVT